MTGDSSSATTSTLSSFSRSSISRSPANSSFCSSPISFSSEVDVTSFVPFLWEEKPGVSKLETQKFGGGGTNGIRSVYSQTADSTDDTSSTTKADHSPAFLPLRPPPRLQRSSKSGSPLHNGDSALSGVRTNAISQSFSRRRQRQRFKSEEDPFWLAMKVCTNEGNSSFDVPPKGMKNTSAIRKQQDQQSLDFLLSFNVPVNRENLSTRTSVRTCALRSPNPKSVVRGCDKQAHPLQSSTKMVLPTFQGKGGHAVMAEEGVFRRSGGNPTGAVAAKVLKKSKSRPSNYSFDSEREQFEPTICAGGKKEIRVPVQTTRYSTQPVELSCGFRVKLKQPSHKQFMPDLLSCKSVNLFFDSVTDPSLYKGGRISPR